MINGLLAQIIIVNVVTDFSRCLRLLSVLFDRG